MKAPKTLFLNSATILTLNSNARDLAAYITEKGPLSSSKSCAARFLSLACRIRRLLLSASHHMQAQRQSPSDYEKHQAARQVFRSRHSRALGQMLQSAPKAAGQCHAAQISGNFLFWLCCCATTGEVMCGEDFGWVLYRCEGQAICQAAQLHRKGQRLFSCHHRRHISCLGCKQPAFSVPHAPEWESLSFPAHSCLRPSQYQHISECAAAALHSLLKRQGSKGMATFSCNLGCIPSTGAVRRLLGA